MIPRGVKKRIYIMAAAVMWFTAGCISVSPFSPTASPAVNPIATGNSITQACLEEVPTLETVLAGVAVLRSEFTLELSLLDITSGRKQLFSEAMPIMAVSPDRLQVGFTEQQSGRLVILNSSGEPVLSKQMPELQRGVVQWIDPGVLLMERFLDNPYGGLAETIKYDLRTNTSEKLDDPPDVATLTPPVEWGNHTFTRSVYDPALSRVVYFANDQNLVPIIALFDIVDNRRLAQFYRPIRDTEPQWMADGQHFIISIGPPERVGKGDPINYLGGYELYRINRDGQAERLTYLSESFRAGEEAFAISPDGGQIAFWLSRNFQPGNTHVDRTLAVLDIATGMVTDLCLEGGPFPFQLVWSPDGKALLVSTSMAQGNNVSEVYLVDLTKKQAAKISTNEIARGWLVK